MEGLAREAIFAALEERLAAADFVLDGDNLRGGVTLASMEFKRGARPEMFARLNQDMRGQVLRYSIFFHACETRIGVLVPKKVLSLLPFKSEEFAERLQAYPAYGVADFPYVIHRVVGNDEAWYDFVFPVRYKDLAHRALAGDSDAQSLFADSLLHELLVINHAFELLISRHMEMSANPSGDRSSSFRFWSKKSRFELLREYDLSASNLLVIRDPKPECPYGEYVLVVPPEGKERERLESLWSVMSVEEFIFDPYDGELNGQDRFATIGK